MHLTEHLSDATGLPVAIEKSDAAGAPVFLDKSESAALSFSSHQDALDYASHVVEDSNRRSAAFGVDIVKSYRHGWIDCYVQLRSRRSNQQCDLSFFRVPRRPFRPLELKESSAIAGLNGKNEAAKSQRNKFAVFLGVTELIYGPEGVIPSFVRLEPFKERYDCRVKIPAYFPLAVNIDAKILDIFCEREIGFLGMLASAGDGGSVPALIQNGPEIIDGIENNAGERFWDWLSESDLVALLSGIRINVCDGGPWLFADESANEAVEIANVMMCASEGKPWAMEQISHERQA